MKTKFFTTSLLIILTISSLDSYAAENLSCSVSILRQHKNLPDPTSPEGPIVIAKPDGTVIQVIQNYSTEVLTDRFVVNVGQNKIIKKLSTAFGKDMEAVVGFKEVVDEDTGLTKAIISTLEIRVLSLLGEQRSIALGREFSAGANLKLTVFNSELATAALKMGMNDIMDDLARPVLEGVLASGSMLFATLECR